MPVEEKYNQTIGRVIESVDRDKVLNKSQRDIHKKYIMNGQSWKYIVTVEVLDANGWPTLETNFENRNRSVSDRKYKET